MIDLRPCKRRISFLVVPVGTAVYIASGKTASTKEAALERLLCLSHVATIVCAWPSPITTGQRQWNKQAPERSQPAPREPRCAAVEMTMNRT